MKKFFKGITGKGKDVDAAFAPDPQQGQYAQDWGVQSEQLAAAPPAYPQQQQGFMVTNGSMRRPRRPRERLDMNYADYAPFAPQPSQPSQPPPAQQPPSVTHEAPLDKQSQLEMDQQLARQLAEQEVQQALAPPFAPPPPPTPPLPEMLGPPQQQQSEQENEADYQAALDKAMQESVVQGDYDNILRDVKLWVRDLDGALGDLGEAQRAARDRRAELDRQMSSADPEDEEGWRQIMWLSERHAETEAKLQDLGWRLKPIDDAVDSLKALDDYTRSEKPPVQEARDGLDRIIAKLLEDLNNMGLAFHHPTNPFGLQPGEGSSKDLEGDGQSRDPLRELVHSLIEETKRGSQARPPAPKPSPQAQPAPPATPVVQPAPETEWASFSDPEPQLQPVELLPEPEPVPEPSVPAEAPAVPELPPLPASPPAVVPAAAKDRPTTPEPRADLPPRAAPKVSPPRSETGSDPGSLAERSAFVRRFLTSTKRTPVPRERVFRPRRSGVKPQPGDAIKRLPRVVALYHELTKPGVVADSVGWQSTKPQAAKGTSSSSSSPGPVKGTTTSTPRTQPRRPAPAASPSVLRGKPPPPQQQQQSPRQQQAKQPASGAAEAVAAAAGAPICTLTPSEQAQLAAEVVAHKPESLEGVAEFVADMRECGADEAGGAGWPADKWAALRDAADVHDALRSMAAELADWKVDAAAGTIAESHRLASFIDRATQEAGRVTYAHEPLRQRMAKQGVPWDESLLVDLRWAAQAAAAELMAHAIDEAAQQGKSKRWQAQAVLQPLGHASMGAFKVHQFCGGLNVRATALFDQLSERTIHFARMIDHHFIRDTKWA